MTVVIASSDKDFNAVGVGAGGIVKLERQERDGLDGRAGARQSRGGTVANRDWLSLTGDTVE